MQKHLRSSHQALIANISGWSTRKRSWKHNVRSPLEARIHFTRDMSELTPDILNNITAVPADCSSRYRRRLGNLAESCNSHPGCFSETRIGGECSGEGIPTSLEGWHGAGMRRTFVTSARATSRLHRPWQFRRARRLIVLAGGLQVTRLSLSRSVPRWRAALAIAVLSNFANSRSRHALSARVAVSNHHARFPDDHSTSRWKRHRTYVAI